MTDDSATWVVLTHTPGPTVSGPIFGDPRFAHHRAFLRAMHERGWLVAAGPFSDRPAEGMTLLRIPEPDALELAADHAEADRSVVEGLFNLEVRPWTVMLESERLRH